MTQPPPIDYRTPEVSQQEARRVFSVSALLVMFFLAILLTVTAFITARFERYFYEFNVSLPAISWGMLKFARFYRKGPGWIMMLAAIITVPFLWGTIFQPKPDSPKRRARHTAVVLFLVLLLIVLVVLVILSLFLPVVNLMDQLSGPKK
jgi:type II secretory pathway component PulF